MRAFERAGRTLVDEKLKAALPRLARHSVEDVFAAVGRGEMSSGDIVKAVHPDLKEERKAGAGPDKADAGWFGLSKAENLRFKIPSSGGSIPIRGLHGDLPVRFAPNGGAVPGDRIIGIMTPGEGITIYPIQSPALMAFDENPERWLDVRWDIDVDRKELFPAQIQITAINEPGCLAAITQSIAEHGANIDDLRMLSRSSDFRTMLIDIEVWDLKQLHAVMAHLRAQPVVSQVERVNG